ncbi:hypothetical protein D3C73_1286400 [compost metagenome]
MIELSNCPHERAKLKKLREVETQIRDIGSQILMKPQDVTIETGTALSELIRLRDNIRISLQYK